MSLEGRLTRWARPAIVWTGLIAMFLTNIIIPLVTHYVGDKPLNLTLDPNFWDAWVWCVSIYVGGRSFEKLGGKTKIGKMLNGVEPPKEDSTK